MELQSLLGNSFDCECGKRHHVPVQKFVYEDGVTEALPGIVKECAQTHPLRSAIVIADNRTWEVYGGMVYGELERDGLKVKKIIIPDRDSRWPVSDDSTCRWLKGRIRGIAPDILVAVGSGVINDLCKWSSFELGLPYIVVATAASMNGYAAAIVSAKIAGVKVVIQARPPIAVVAEPAVIENAPLEMTAAGFGDTIAKSQSNADWLLNNFLFGEYHCSYCAEMLTGLESLYLKSPENVRDATSEAVKGLFEALFWTGIAITLVGTSAPASGGEHLLSHTLDMVADINNEENDLHGRQVGLGAILSAALYERLLKIERTAFAELPEGIDEKFWSLPTVVEAVSEQYEKKKLQLEIVREKIAQKAVWKEIKVRLRPTLKGPGELKDLLRRAGGASSIAEVGCSREQIKAAVLHTHEIRERFTVVDLAWVLGVLPTAVDEIIDEWLIE